MHAIVGRRWLVAGLGALVILAACASVAPPSAPGGPAAQPAARKTLTFGVGGEPRGMGQLFTGGNNVMAPIFTIVHDFLSRIDDQGNAVPSLALELPSQEKGTWVLNPDGTMVTTWKMRPNVTWHDGTPFHPEDVAFGFAVSVHPDVPYGSRRVPGNIDRIEAPDAQTLVINWKVPYPFADRLELGDLYPLPRHILQKAFEEAPQDLQTASYWRQEFVGLGPYKLREWAPGSHMTLEANANYHLGKPKIDTQIHRFIADDNTLLANLLAGEIDIIVPATNLNAQQRETVRERWEAIGQGRIVPNLVGRFRYMAISFRNPVLHDVRIRQAFVHALDRAALAEVILLDRDLTIDSWITPAMPRYQRAKAGIQTYEYDPTRAVRLLEEAGYPGGPTAVRTPAGEQMRVEYRGQAQEGSLTCANWRAIGVLCDETVMEGPLSRDPEYQASYQWFYGTAGPASLGFVGRMLHSSQIPTAERRWQGSNDGGIRDPEVDRLIDTFNRTVNPSEQERVELNLASLVSRQLYVYPLYTPTTSLYIRQGITGPKPMAAVGASGDLWNTWNVHEWDRT